MSGINPSNSVDMSSAGRTYGADLAQSTKHVDRQAASKDVAVTEQVQAMEESSDSGLPSNRERAQSVADALGKYNRNLSFSVNEYSETNVVVEVRTVGDNALVRQIPQEELLKLSERLAQLDGLDFEI